jgi:DNA repair protein RadA/Sms
MAKPRLQYACTACGGVTVKWQGQCPHCNAWNTLEEGRAESAAGQRFRAPGSAPQKMVAMDAVPADTVSRMPTGSSEFDRVLGGGMVEGSVVLIGGDPGVGKSTLLLQALAHMGSERKVLYVSAEESAAQIALRARRLGLDGAAVALLAETELENILPVMESTRPSVVVIDSIQTIYSNQLSSAPGSVAQVRECAAQLTRFAKQLCVGVVMIGHVTKEGTLAGPRVLEHIVDTVLYFEGETHSSHRLVRAFKNRFGAVNELGVFAMTETGLRGVANPSAIFLSRAGREVPGSSVLVTQEGSRPLLVEVQALVDGANAPNPRRLSVGFDANRLALLLAVLHRHAGIALFDQDVFVNVVGGVRISEPAADLAVMLAVVSSLRNRPLARELAVFGELGLTGEIRPAPRGQERLREAAKIGFSRLIVPRANLPRRPIEGVATIGVERLDEVLAAAWE